jgi:hypothetical protein
MSLVSYANAREVLRQAAQMLDDRDDSAPGGPVLEARDAL